MKTDYSEKFQPKLKGPVVSRNFLRSVGLTALVLAIFVPMAQAQVTPGFDFYVDASDDVDGAPVNDIWKDLVPGNPSGFAGLRLNQAANAPIYGVSGSTFSGITNAYTFVGGQTGQNGGVWPVRPSETTPRSFQEATGNWSDESVSIEMWFRPNNLNPSTNNGQILFEDGGGNGLGFFLDNNEIRLRTASGGGNAVYNLDTDPLNLLLGSDATDEFIQIVGTFDRSGNPDDIELFVNGISVDTDTTGNQNDWSGGDAAGIGTRGDSNTGGIGNGQSGTESFDGDIALFRVYRDQILTADEVLANFETTSAPLVAVPEPASIAIWSLLGLCLAGYGYRRRRGNK